MKKIPTVFVRDPDDRAHVLNEVTPGCEWVLAGEGTPTRKRDGTCVKIDEDGTTWARREVKPGKPQPDGFIVEEYDETTGKTVGWEPAGQSSYAKLLTGTLEVLDGNGPVPGTYELCGPKVNGNPEGFSDHVLARHGGYVLYDVPRDYDGLREWLLARNFEGIVWHHPDGRMAKLKRRDYGK